MFRGFDDKAKTQPETGGVGRFYETLDMSLALTPQAMLAWEMNGVPLPVPHGAPLRLRVETQLGFKMVKWIQSIEFVERGHARILSGCPGPRPDARELPQRPNAAVIIATWARSHRSPTGILQSCI